jgi:hypothetical protein
MQTRVTQKYYPRGRISGIAIITSCAAAILLAGALSSIGGTNGIPAPARVAALPNPADSKRIGEREDVATLLAWHVEARTLNQYAYQITLAEPSRQLAEADRPSALPVAARLRKTIVR